MVIWYAAYVAWDTNYLIMSVTATVVVPWKRHNIPYWKLMPLGVDSVEHWSFFTFYGFFNRCFVERKRLRDCSVVICTLGCGPPIFLSCVVNIFPSSVRSNKLYSGIAMKLLLTIITFIHRFIRRSVDDISLSAHAGWTKNVKGNMNIFAVQWDVFDAVLSRRKRRH